MSIIDEVVGTAFRPGIQASSIFPKGRTPTFARVRLSGITDKTAPRTAKLAVVQETPKFLVAVCYGSVMFFVAPEQEQTIPNVSAS